MSARDRRSEAPLRASRIGVAVALALLSACATQVPAEAPMFDPPRYEAPASQPRIALVLSGGAARGFAHLGVLRVLEREGLGLDSSSAPAPARSSARCMRRG
jgi:NTE family protein